MKKIFNEYINIVGYTILGLIFGLSFFLLLTNLYHMDEVNKTYVKTDDDLKIVETINAEVLKINNNISYFDLNTYKGSYDLYDMSEIKNKLEICVKNINQSDINSYLLKEEITLVDVYNLQQSFQIDIANECLIRQMYDLTVAEGDYNTVVVSSNIAPFMDDNIKQLISSNDYLAKDLKNNSSYYFNSNYASVNLINPVKDSYYQVVSNYTKSIDFVVDVSTWYNSLGGV